MTDIPRDAEGYPKDPLSRSREMQVEGLLRGLTPVAAPRSLRAEVMAELRTTPAPLMTRLRQRWARLGGWRIPLQLAPIAALVAVVLIAKDSLTMRSAPSVENSAVAQAPALRLDGAQLAQADEARDQILNSAPNVTVPADEAPKETPEPVQTVEADAANPVPAQAQAAPPVINSAPAEIAMAAANTTALENRIPFRFQAAGLDRRGSENMERFPSNPMVHSLASDRPDFGDSRAESMDIATARVPFRQDASVAGPAPGSAAAEAAPLTDAPTPSRIPSLAERMAPTPVENAEDLAAARTRLLESHGLPAATASWVEPTTTTASPAAPASPRESAMAESFTPAPAALSLAQVPAAPAPAEIPVRHPLTPQQLHNLGSAVGALTPPEAETDAEQMSFTSTDPRGLMDHIAELVTGYGGTTINRAAATADERMFRMTVNIPRYRVQPMQREIAVMSDPGIAAAASALPAAEAPANLSPQDREFTRVHILISLRDN